MSKYFLFNLTLIISISLLSFAAGAKPTNSLSLTINTENLTTMTKNTFNISLIYSDQFHTPTELHEELENILSNAPNLVDMFTIGKSIQGREIYCLKITNKLDNRPKANSLIIAQHHSREQITVEASLRFILRLINNYGLDANITDYIDSQDIYVIPTLNPDGLYYVVGNRSGLQPNEWLRKNLRAFDDDNDGLFDEDPAEDVNGDGIISGFDVYLKDLATESWIYSYDYLEGIDNDGDGLINEDRIGGVDLNRNYDYRWNDSSLDTGASGDTRDDTFPGTAPFSEPETQAYRDFVANYSFATAISLHSGINTTYFPWASTYGYAEPTLYYNIFNDIKKILPDRFGSSISNHGSSSSSISYTCAGEWGDWMYARQDCLVPMTFEIFHKAGSNKYDELIVENDTHQIWRWDGMRDYFAPSEDKIDDLWIDIQPVFDYWLDNTPRLDVFVKSLQGSFTEGSSITVTLTVRNLSPRIKTIKSIDVVTDSFVPLKENGNPISFSEFTSLESRDLSFDVVINKSAIDQGNLTVMLGNAYVGYYPITIESVNVTKRTSFDFGFLLLAVPLLVYIKKKKSNNSGKI
ncbi:MAG: M14 family zinc carboxypeptidase [Candidatus Hodarchaeales archaeon]